MSNVKYIRILINWHFALNPSVKLFVYSRPPFNPHTLLHAICIRRIKDVLKLTRTLVHKCTTLKAQNPVSGFGFWQDSLDLWARDGDC